MVNTIKPAVVVAVLTYRRNDDLNALIPMVLGQLDEVEVPTQLLVVDNDPESGAEKVILTFFDNRIKYVSEPRPGIAAARNRALLESEAATAVVFLDDDERPTPGWLLNLWRTYLATGAAGVVGPVISSFSGSIDPWITGGGFFDRRRLPTGTPVQVAASNNLLLDCGELASLGLRFDDRLGLIGGSDNLFTQQLSRSGEKIIWCDEACVLDIVPSSRVTRSWVLRRSFRTGNGTSLVELVLTKSLIPRTMTRARLIGVGLSRMAFGLGRVVGGWATRSVPRQARGFRNLARGAGLITGALGISYAEYRR